MEVVKKYHLRSGLLATTMICTATVAALAGSANAQTTTAPAAPPSSDESSTTVVVTGSRISVPTNAKSPSPISVLTSEQIDQTKSTLVEDALARMIGPDANSTTIGSNNGGDGYSSVSMRNLGANRTLVLVDGTRVIPAFNGTSNFVDLNSIPLSMVERIEVLRDGASSIYGADAIGGVVNIITKKRQDGLKLDLNYGISGQSDGETKGFDLSYGAHDDRGAMMLGLSYDHRDAIAGSNRSWATDAHLNGPGEGGSAYRSQLDILQDEYSSDVWANGMQYNIHNPVVATLAPNLTYLPTVGKVKMDANGPGWNTLTGSMDRKVLSFNSHYDITSNIRFISEGFYSDRTSTQLLRPEPLLGDTIATYTSDGSIIFPGLIIPADAPGNAAATGVPGGRAVTAYLTPVQFGPRTYEQDSKTFRARVGLEGKIWDRFKWDLGYVYQTNDAVLSIGNSGNWNHIAQITEEIACIDVPGGCTNGKPNVEPNWFGDPTKIFTPAQLAYLEYTRKDTESSAEKYAYANISGPVYTLPAGDIKFAAGAETRKEYAAYTPDQLTSEGWTANAANPTAGGYTVTAFYGELFVPILADLPFAKSLNFTPSYRHDQYSSFGGAGTYKLGVDWAVSPDVRLRYTYSTGFRAPTVAELYGGQFVSDNGASGDPCDTRVGANSNGNSNAGQALLNAGSTCSTAVAGGAAVTNFQDPLNNGAASQIQTLEGGNPALKPEKSIDISYGAIFTPRFLPGFSAEADYYRIKINNAILAGGIAGNQGNDFILLGCYGPEQNKTFCSDVVRNSNGVITQINSLDTNAGSQFVDGWEYELTYDTKRADLKLPFPGSVKVDLQASRMDRDSQLNVDGSTSVYRGTFNTDNETIYPTWRGVLNLDYSVSKWAFHWDTRYTERVISANGGDPTYGNVIPNMYYSAVSATYYLDQLAAVKNARLIVGVDNLFDKDPPFITSDATCKCNTLAGPFDVVGRFFYTRLQLDF
jgi:iron complex outermembrane receptor protein